ncbi:hypothetical protein ABZT26_25725 [Streptomyces sp. NPDC005395]|uniref:hypothetical protein n=1 Tax=Streptomyces sp. NPDC005395 TaxID=3157042 RepID=UPI0033BCF344
MTNGLPQSRPGNDAGEKPPADPPPVNLVVHPGSKPEYKPHYLLPLFSGIPASDDGPEPAA